MRVARVFRLPVIAALAALALAGCVQTAGPVALAQPQDDLDSIAYGPAPVAVVRSDVAGPGGAIGALRNAFAATPRQVYAPVPVVYARAPMPTTYDASYRLDAGDKLRVVVYGQEGPDQFLRDRRRRLDHHAADRRGAGARANPGGAGRRDHGQAAQWLYPRSLGGGGDRILPAVLHPGRSRGPPANIPMFPT